MKYELFWGGPFSNFYPCKITVDGLEFNTTEQYFMFKKAITFGDFGTAVEIFISTEPKEQKKLGRRVEGFREDIWNRVARDFMFRANMAKYTQNDSLRSILCRTKLPLVEASPYDKIWGVGLGADNPDVQDKDKWQGQNWLGEILTEIRDIIR